MTHANEQSPLIQIDSLYKKFGDHSAVNGLSLTVSGGEIVVLLGPNGAGKTTTINCLLGFLQPDQGSVSVLGFDPVTQVNEARSQLAYIPEQVALYPKLTGMENLKFMAGINGTRHTHDELMALFERVNLSAEFVDNPIASYSKGMRQKVGIAIALAKQARVLILDEPTSGLDPSASYDFSQLIQSLAAEQTGILLATHDLYRAQEDASRVVIMNKGKAVSLLCGEELKDVELEAIYLEQVRDIKPC